MTAKKERDARKGEEWLEIDEGLPKTSKAYQGLF